jgi:hypothetical protein
MPQYKYHISGTDINMDASIQISQPKTDINMDASTQISHPKTANEQVKIQSICMLNTQDKRHKGDTQKVYGHGS